MAPHPSNHIKVATAKIIAILFLFLLTNCKKDWLDAKPNLALVVPTTIADYQALLDNTTTPISSSPGGDVGFNASQTVLNEIGSGDFYLKDADYNANSALFRNTYT